LEAIKEKEDKTEK